MAKKKKGSLRQSFLVMTIVPVVVFAVVIVLFSYQRFKSSVNKEVETELKNNASIIANTFDELYPGDYSIKASDKYEALVKGDEYVAASQDYLETLKQDTGNDISFFYGKVRYVTTLTDKEGKSLVGTSVNYSIQTDVIDGNKGHFYSSVLVNDEKYEAYYMPLCSTSGEVIGMLGVTKSAAEVTKLVWKAVIPIFIITAIAVLFAGAITVSYAKKTLGTFTKLSRFINAVGGGNLEKDLDANILARNDEIGEIGMASVKMQKSIRNLVERDALTSLYNRRYANSRLKKTYEGAAENGMNVSLSIGDIDFFKKFNDRYGHDIGDVVLVAVANTLQTFMTGKGFVARWGGEEFLLCFEKDNLEKSEYYLNQLLEKIHEIAIPHGDEVLKINMSFGVTQVRIGDENETIDSSVKRADERLYEAKENGRNQVRA